LDGFYTRPTIGKNGSLMSVKIHRLTIKTFNHLGAIDYRRVVHDKITPAAEMIIEAMHIAEREERRREH